jgi:glycosyltransferase involved in cell wall biosynthesis
MTQSMRIALITDGIWPYVIGGMQKHSYYLCKYLAQKQIHVDLFHFNASGYDISKLEFFSEEEKKYIHSFIVPIPTDINFPGHYIYKSYKHSQLIFELLKDKLKDYHFIYTKGFTGWYLIDQKFKKKISCAPIGVKFHGYEMFQKPPNLKIKWQHIFLLREPVKIISKKADVVFSYGGKITEIIRSLGVEEQKIFELPSGVEESMLAESIIPTNEKINFLFLGRYERRKGIEELNEAIELFFKERERKSVEFHFVGPIPVSKQINRKEVIYQGEIRDKLNLTKVIRSCDVLICPSWSEGMPNVILEAMANGLAVIATDVGATCVLVNEKTGWLLPEVNIQEIKEAIETVYNSTPSRMDALKQNALNHVKNNYTWERLIIKFQKKFLDESK